MTYASDVLALSPVSYWRFGETSGTTANDEQNAHDGTYAQPGLDMVETGSVAGDADTSFLFSGVSSELVTTTGWSLSSAAYTVVAAVKVHSTPPTTFHATIMGLQVDATQRARIYARRNAASNRLAYWDNTNTFKESTATLAPGSWAHVAVRVNGTAVAFFVNGAAAGTGVLTAPADSYVDINIGGASTAGDPMKGHLDEVAIWSSALTDTQIGLLYTSWSTNGAAALTAAAETDTAQALARRKSRTETPATTTNTAVALGRLKARTGIPAAETDTASPLARRKSRTQTATTESDAATTLARVKRRELTPASEAESALSIAGGTTGGGLISLSLIPAQETDAAVALGRLARKALTPTTEADSAAQGFGEGGFGEGGFGGSLLGYFKRRTVTPATETDASVVLARRKARTLTPSSANDGVVALVRTKTRGLTPAVELDSTVGAGRKKTRTLVPAIETDAATTLTRVRVGNLNPAVESNSADSLGRLRSHGLIAATETETAGLLAVLRARSLTPAPEVDSAWLLVALTGVVSDITATATLVRRWSGRPVDSGWAADVVDQSHSASLAEPGATATLVRRWRATT